MDELKARGLRSTTALLGDIGSTDPISPRSAVDSRVGACPCRRTGSHFAGTCARVSHQKPYLAQIARVSSAEISASGSAATQSGAVVVTAPDRRPSNPDN